MINKKIFAGILTIVVLLAAIQYVRPVLADDTSTDQSQGGVQHGDQSDGFSHIVSALDDSNTDQSQGGIQHGDQSDGGPYFATVPVVPNVVFAA